MTHTMRDPVCGMEVDPAKSRFTHEHAGQTYYFCCGGCQTAFKTDPAQFLDPESSAPEATPSASAEASADTWFICPMDPEVREPEPGACPKCGMALEAELGAPALAAINRIANDVDLFPLGFALGGEHAASAWASDCEAGGGTRSLGIASSFMKNVKARATKSWGLFD